MNNATDVRAIVVSTISLVVLMGSFIILFILRYRQRQAEHEKEKKQLRLEQEGEMMKAQLEISEDLMRKISLEIHDNIGQTLSLAKLQLHGLNAHNFIDHSKNTADLLSRAIHDLRNLSKSLNGNFVMEIGLEEAIRREVNIVQSSGQVNCEYHAGPDHIVMNGHQEVILFRCVQEVLNNCVKHSQARNIVISSSVNNAWLHLSVGDDGIGMDLGLPRHNGLGLNSLQQRARIMNGTCRFESAPGKGMKVVFEVPVLNNFVA